MRLAGDIVSLALVIEGRAADRIDGAPWNCASRHFVGTVSALVGGRIAVVVQHETDHAMTSDTMPAMDAAGAKGEVRPIARLGPIAQAGILWRLRREGGEAEFRRAGWDVRRWGEAQTLWTATLKGRGAELMVAPFGTTGPRPLQGVYDVHIEPLGHYGTISAETVERVIEFLVGTAAQERGKGA